MRCLRSFTAKTTNGMRSLHLATPPRTSGTSTTRTWPPGTATTWTSSRSGTTWTPTAPRTGSGTTRRWWRSSRTGSRFIMMGGVQNMMSGFQRDLSVVPRCSPGLKRRASFGSDSRKESCRLKSCQNKASQHRQPNHCPKKMAKKGRLMMVAWPVISKKRLTQTLTLILEKMTIKKQKLQRGNNSRKSLVVVALKKNNNKNKAKQIRDQEEEGFSICYSQESYIR
mmetsp:Transcript_22580/g.34051  ORF Transcript_22580/g.34051 Transcript_22580/m.34051 type:complete len:225 (+) Transcript_22580:133-807(+)